VTPAQIAAMVAPVGLVVIAAGCRIASASLHADGEGRLDDWLMELLDAGAHALIVAAGVTLGITWSVSW
jgi:hypothetical protein